MKNINIPLYAMGFLSFFLGQGVFGFLQGGQNFVVVFIGALLLIGGINISSILFYKVLDTKDEISKYAFSFLHIVCLVVMSISLGLI